MSIQLAPARNRAMPRKIGSGSVNGRTSVLSPTIDAEQRDHRQRRHRVPLDAHHDPDREQQAEHVQRLGVQQPGVEDQVGEARRERGRKERDALVEEPAGDRIQQRDRRGSEHRLHERDHQRLVVFEPDRLGDPDHAGEPTGIADRMERGRQRRQEQAVPDAVGDPACAREVDERVAEVRRLLLHVQRPRDAEHERDGEHDVEASRHAPEAVPDRDPLRGRRHWAATLQSAALPRGGCACS